jgi:hypothetical protein
MYNMVYLNWWANVVKICGHFIVKYNVYTQFWDPHFKISEIGVRISVKKLYCMAKAQGKSCP